jgi:hypothetical protein
MKRFKILKYNPKKDRWEYYGVGYTAEDVKIITKGFHNHGLFYGREGSKIIYEVVEYQIKKGE